MKLHPTARLAAAAAADGDTIPRRVLSAGEGSASDVSAVGAASWHDGFRDVTQEPGRMTSIQLLICIRPHLPGPAHHRTAESLGHHAARSNE